MYRALIATFDSQEDDIIEYIDFCVNNSKDNGHKHHILPKIVFPEHKNLKKNPWNCAVLNVDDHIAAHKLFCKICDDYRMKYAVVTLSKYKNCDGFNKVKLWKEWANSIAENDKTNLENLTAKTTKTKTKSGYYDNWGKLMSSYLNTEINIDGILMSNAKINSVRALKTKHETVNHEGLNIIQQAVNKTKKTMNTIESNGKTIRHNTTIKIQNTRKNKTNAEGLTVNQQHGLKLKEIMNTVIEHEGDIIKLGKLYSIPMRTKCLEMKQSNELTHELGGKQYTFSEYVGKKISQSKNNQIILFRGIEMVRKKKQEIVAKEKQELAKQREESKRFFKLHDINGKIDDIIYTRKEIKNITQALFRTSTSNPLGKTRQSRDKLIKANKEHLIGSYIIEI